MNYFHLLRYDARYRTSLTISKLLKDQQTVNYKAKYRSMKQKRGLPHTKMLMLLHILKSSKIKRQVTMETKVEQPPPPKKPPSTKIATFLKFR